MRNRFRWISASALLVVGHIAGSISAQELFPEGQGRDTLLLVCVQCHTPVRITNAKLSAADWEFTLYDMISRGAPVHREDIDDLKKYLIDNFAVADK